MSEVPLEYLVIERRSAHPHLRWFLLVQKRLRSLRRQSRSSLASEVRHQFEGVQRMLVTQLLEAFVELDSDWIYELSWLDESHVFPEASAEK